MYIYIIYGYIIIWALAMLNLECQVSINLTLYVSIFLLDVLEQAHISDGVSAVVKSDNGP